jgi:RHS repeat-associated protein
LRFKTGIFSFSYDAAGRFYKETAPDGKATTRQLDKVANITKLTYPDGYFVTRVFDQLNRLTDLKLNGATSSAIHITYDQLSRRATLTYGNGASSTYTFQLNEDLTTLAEAFVGSSVSFTHTFNKVHQEKTRSVTDGTYLWHPSAGGTVSYGTANNVNEYPTVGSASYTYDGNGNLHTDGTWTYTYDTENHLTAASKTGTSVSYVYDPDHRQIQKTVGSTKSRYVYNRWQRIADYDGSSGSLQNRYVYGTNVDEPLVQISSGGTVTYLHADRIGSLIAVTNSSGSVTGTAKYSGFGEGMPPSGTTFGFTGQRYDSDTGLYYYKRRYYSVAIGRFLQPDPVRNDLNLYGYVQNDPLNRRDPLGLFWQYIPFTPAPTPNPPIGPIPGPTPGPQPNPGPVDPNPGCGSPNIPGTVGGAVGAGAGAGAGGAVGGGIGGGKDETGDSGGPSTPPGVNLNDGDKGGKGDKGGDNSGGDNSGDKGGKGDKGGDDDTNRHIPEDFTNEQIYNMLEEIFNDYDLTPAQRSDLTGVIFGEDGVTRALNLLNSWNPPLAR